MAFMDKIKAKAAELGLDEKAALAKEKATAAADANRDKIAGAVDKAGQAVDSKTGGKYSDKIIQAQDAALKGVDKVAAAGTGTASGTTTGSFGETAVGSEHAFDADLADDRNGGENTGGGNTGETATERAIGADAMSTSDAAGSDETPIERAIGADATTTSLDPHPSTQGEGLESAGSEADHAGRDAGTNGETPMRRVGDTPQS